MTNEKAIERIKAFSVFLTGGNPIWDVDECKEAFDIALAAMSERNLDEWCDNCKEYDHDKHCCPRFNRVIRETVEEVKQNAESKWIPVSEKLPEESIKQIMLGDEHTSDFVLVTIKGQTYPFPKTKVRVARYSYTHKAWQIANNNLGKVVAWMPLPRPWKGEEG